MFGVYIFFGIALVAIFGFGVLPGYISLGVGIGILMLLLYPAVYFIKKVIETWRDAGRVGPAIINLAMLLVAAVAVAAVWGRNGENLGVIAYLFAIVVLENVAL